MDEQVIRLICLRIKRLQNKRLLFSLRKEKAGGGRRNCFLTFALYATENKERRDYALIFSTTMSGGFWEPYWKTTKSSVSKQQKAYWIVFSGVTGKTYT